LLQKVRDEEAWEEYLIYVLTVITITAKDTLQKVKNIKEPMAQYKIVCRNIYKFYSQNLLNHVSKQPYTKIECLQNEMNISRITAANYLNQMAADGHLSKHKIGTTNYYVNGLVLKALETA